MTGIIEIILLGSCISSVFMALRNDDILTLFYCFGFTTLYVGQYFYLAHTRDSEKKAILGEYGYTSEIAQYILIYLILIYSTLSISTYFANRRGTILLGKQNIESNVTFISQLYYAAMLLGALTVYGTIIGWESFNDTRPNMNRGGTFGMFLCMAVAVSACTLWCSTKTISIANVCIFLASSAILILAGARISVIYLFLTLALTIGKYKHIRLGFLSLILATVISAGVLIIAQAVKEFTGGLVELDSLWDSVMFTSGVFYNAQTEAFVSTASTLQYQVDHSPIQVNGGVTIVNFLNLLLPSFLKSNFTFDLSSFVVYDRSIIPSAGSFFLQGFFFYGVLLHCFFIFLTIWYSNKIKRSQLRPSYVVYFFFTQAACGVTLIRGPIDLLPFTVIAIGIMVFFFEAFKRLLKIK